MMIGLLLFFGAYGIAIAAIHLAYARQRRLGRVQPVRHILMVKNNQHQAEWFLRCLLFFSYWRGRNVIVTVFDEGSEDDTMKIVRQFAERHCEVEIRDAGDDADRYMAEHAEESFIVTRLSRFQGTERFPMPQW